MKILYLTFDVSDPTTLKRVNMLRVGGAEVVVAGFRRSSAPVLSLDGTPVVDMGRTYPARFLHRIACVLRSIRTLRKHQALFAGADIVMARNLEMLAITVRGLSLNENRTPLVYECLDIHRLMLRDDFIGKRLRALEGWLCRRAALLVTSSPAFVREYFNVHSTVKLSALLLENKVLELAERQSSPTTIQHYKPWRIGWFGILRCRRSFEALLSFASTHSDTVEIVLRGRPAYDQIPDFDARVASTPGVSYGGPYLPEDVPGMYANVHFSWAIDLFEAGMNSNWLLPNRLYDSGYYRAVPLALKGVETATVLNKLGIGHVFPNIEPATLADFFGKLSPAAYATMKQAVEATSLSLWRFTKEDCVAFVSKLSALRVRARAPYPSTKPLLVVIPTLNEATHLPALLDYLIEEAKQQPMTIVVADGGSRDGTIDIIRHATENHAFIHYLDNHRRIQSAAINLAVAIFGNEADFLVRLDAHASYPRGFCSTLLLEAQATQADSVVVSMRTIGERGFQKAVALAQNSKLGNGGSAHRLATGEGTWVDHGHHALMRIEAFRAVGGYDERFTHNEDAELDIRLARAGYRHWLTAKTTKDYFPRSTPRALFNQYLNYGRGRARTSLKHQIIPKLRQAIPLCVAPACLLVPASPLTWLAALPFMLWAGTCLVYGVRQSTRHHSTIGLEGALAAMIMHFAWSFGFWQKILAYRKMRTTRKDSLQNKPLVSITQL